MQDGAYVVAFQPQDDFYLTLINNEGSKKVLGETLVSCGAATGEVRAELMKDKAAEQRETQAEESMQTLFDTFGRDSVQVSE